MDRNALIAELSRDEGTRLIAYDDADSSPLKPGMLLKGHPTIGTGRALDVNGITQAENLYLLNNDIDRALTSLIVDFPGFKDLDDVRQRALANLYFNVPSFLKWENFMRYAKDRDWDSAATELESTHPWITQVGARGHRIAAMLRTGEAQH